MKIVFADQNGPLAESSIETAQYLPVQNERVIFTDRDGERRQGDVTSRVFDFSSGAAQASCTLLLEGLTASRRQIEESKDQAREEHQRHRAAPFEVLSPDYGLDIDETERERQEAVRSWKRAILSLLHK